MTGGLRHHDSRPAGAQECGLSAGQVAGGHHVHNGGGLPLQRPLPRQVQLHEPPCCRPSFMDWATMLRLSLVEMPACVKTPKLRPVAQGLNTDKLSTLMQPGHLGAPGPRHPGLAAGREWHQLCTGGARRWVHSRLGQGAGQQLLQLLRQLAEALQHICSSATGKTYEHVLQTPEHRVDMVLPGSAGHAD